MEEIEEILDVKKVICFSMITPILGCVSGQLKLRHFSKFWHGEQAVK